MLTRKAESNPVFPEISGESESNEQQKIQNVVLVWLDDNIETNSEDSQNTLTKLQQIVNNVQTFTDNDQCIEFIISMTDNRVFLITSGAIARNIVPCVHDISQLNSFLIFCANKEYHEQWAKDWPKIRGVFTDIKLVCDILKNAARECEKNAISMSFVTSDKRPDQLPASFMYTQLIKETLLRIQFEECHIREYFDYCRKLFANNKVQLDTI
ncbi:unnamed protein product, partial [Adineta ricciae]